MTAVTPDLLLVFVIAVLVSCGVYLILERTLTRVALGLILLGNGINILFIIIGGDRGGPPIVGLTPESEMSDPLPQAMILTAIVITLALTAFLLSMAYRSWQLNAHDEVQDDLEDRRILRLADMATGPAAEEHLLTLAEEAERATDEVADFVEEHWQPQDHDEGAP